MKLQINLAGSWRNVLSFSDADVELVKEHGQRLVKLAEGRPSLRIATDDNVALAYCSHPEFAWREAW